MPYSTVQRVYIIYDTLLVLFFRRLTVSVSLLLSYSVVIKSYCVWVWCFFFLFSKQGPVTLSLVYIERRHLARHTHSARTVVIVVYIEAKFWIIWTRIMAIIVVDTDIIYHYNNNMMSPVEEWCTQFSSGREYTAGGVGIRSNIIIYEYDRW